MPKPQYGGSRLQTNKRECVPEIPAHRKPQVTTALAKEHNDLARRVLSEANDGGSDDKAGR